MQWNVMQSNMQHFILGLYTTKSRQAKGKKKMGSDEAKTLQCEAQMSSSWENMGFSENSPNLMLHHESSETWFISYGDVSKPILLYLGG